MTIPDHIQLRMDTSANFSIANPTLVLGEAGIEQDTGRFKIGDALNNWNGLTYFPELGPAYLKEYNKAALPDSTTSYRASIFVADETGGPQPAYCDGTDWRRYSDGAIVS